MGNSRHWTSANTESFIHRIAFDFIAQLEKRMEALPFSQAKLAEKLKVSEGAVSQVLNNSRNPNLKTIVSYARALGMKVAIVAYDDSDPENERGPVNAEILNSCWEKAGRPRDVFDLQEKKEAVTVGNLLLVPSAAGSRIYKEPCAVSPSDYVSMKEYMENYSSEKQSAGDAFNEQEQTMIM